ncbi:TonB family protein [Cyclobacterium jeungdonense]|uniref:M56 family metallopeptidase n=1 Tax=Cyclobacterium jeungdonense TaxID=708087 RepID=A0ABT8C4H8_9BACT|nr:M56 family metallopeptidase [Cyclobacterium jeungdonense]MDN3687664.1 M56 family metallopeptidase [Cyclobacterium jeungdonense]
MNALLNYLLEGTVCLALMGLFYRLFLTRNTFFTWNRAYLLTAFGIAWIVPALNIPLLTDTVVFKEVLTYQLPAMELSSMNPQTVTTSWNTLSFLLSGIYLTGLVFFLIRFGWGLRTLYTQALIAKKSSWGNYTLLEHPDFEPSSFFHWIFLPPEHKNRADREWILAHEAAHGRLLHSLDVLLYQVLKITFWFFPFIRFFEKALLEVHEYQVDQKMTENHPKEAYVDLLLHLIRPVQQGTLVNNFNQFQLKKRLNMMYQPKSPVLARISYALVLPLIGLLLVFFACETQEEKPNLNLSPEEQISERVMQGEVFDVVEDMPYPAGGMEGWNAFLRENLTYPEAARKDGIEGTVYAIFTIDTEGDIHDVELLRGVDPRLDQEALRVLRKAPAWTPGKQKGIEVPVKMRVPIRFKLN